MKTSCPKCGTEMHRVRENEAYHYTMARLKDVYLHGVREYACPSCGQETVQIPSLLGLHKTLAALVVDAYPEFTGDAVHFLREYLCMSRPEWAGILGVPESDVVAWEEERAAVPKEIEKRIRNQVALGPDPEPFKRTRPAHLDVTWTDQLWVQDALR